jgi:hypothetical protein
MGVLSPRRQATELGRGRHVRPSSSGNKRLACARGKAELRSLQGLDGRVDGAKVATYPHHGAQVRACTSLQLFM